ncbi:MAG: hypothetical protein GY790_16620 [Bacteroidetes bacterium]|nr:hypothetical protein [Bacteroidota bacterium]
MKKFLSLLVSLLFTGLAVYGQHPDNIVLKNDHVEVEFRKSNNAYTLSGISRPDGTDHLSFKSSEFEILLLNDERVTVDDYELCHFDKSIDGDLQILKLDYTTKKETQAPKELSIVYTLGNDSYFRKQIIIESDSSAFIDRLQVLRFTTEQEVSGGGYGQPLFINNWFIGMDYPGFYSRHSCNFKEPEYNMRVPYTIDLEGRDREFAEEPGLVTLFHFPGYARESKDSSFRIISKKVVIGISPDSSKNAELALLNYIDQTRLTPRSFLHFNNWYSIDAKNITIEDFVEKTYLPIKNQLDKYGVKLDAMVPDHGWQDGKFEQMPYRVYSPKIDMNHEALPEISAALRENGTNLGIWLAIDGRNMNIDMGVEKAGYRSALSDTFDREKYRWTSSKAFFDILDEKYQSDLKESIKYLVDEAHVNYFKHDFNHLFTSNYITERHARERCLDVTLDLMKYERELNPDLFLNFTNGSWFSPFWFQHVHSLWMMSGDSGGNGDYPQLSFREGATTYRDKYFYDNFRMERPDRPVIPIANFMTHGILFSKRKPFTDFKDIIDDWSNYVVMYYARGTTVKELYITHDLLSDEEWEVLGKASKWAVENQQNLLRTVYIGGDPSLGDAYGYISWNDKKAILTVRNPQRIEQRISVPFNEKVYYTGDKGLKYNAKCVYPFVEPMPWQLTSGEDFTVDIPGDCVMVFEIGEGESMTGKAATPAPIPEAKAESNGNKFSISFIIPDKEYRRFELLVETWPALNSGLLINDQIVEAGRENRGKRWSLSSWDLRKYRGQEVTIGGDIQIQVQPGLPENYSFKIYLLEDQKVDEAEVGDIENLPLNIMQGYRRSTKLILDSRFF